MFGVQTFVGLAYQWRGLGGPLVGETNSTYTIASFSGTDAGRYRVIITNAAGVVTSSIATLSLNIAPAITTQPANRTVLATSNATFTVVATGTAPLSYQWQHNSTNLPGAKKIGRAHV